MLYTVLNVSILPFDHLNNLNMYSLFPSFQFGVTRALIGGGGGEGRLLFIYSCSARLISFEMNLKTTDFKLCHWLVPAAQVVWIISPNSSNMQKEKQPFLF